ncbi:MAG: sel1 repeat family protein [Rhodospirillales bacterium]|nr:sel1 repeat family protein [Rhodospirillales bacterium]
MKLSKVFPKSRISAAFLSLGVIFLVSQATLLRASEPNVPIHECDQLAAHPSDSQRVTDSPPDWFMASEKAIAECRAALEAYPDSARFKFQLGYLLAINSRYQESFDLLRNAAEQDYAAAMYDLSNALKFGRGTRTDKATALIWLRNAAHRSNSWAQYDLGLLYLFGEDLDEDTEKTLMWLTKSANSGFDVAQFLLGSLYLDNFGIGIGNHTWPSNPVDGVKWIRKSAAQGNGYAQLLMGLMYVSGLGLPRDPEKGKKWFVHSKRQGVTHADAREFLSAPSTAEMVTMLLTASKAFRGEKNN